MSRKERKRQERKGGYWYQNMFFPFPSKLIYTHATPLSGEDRNYRESEGEKKDRKKIA